MCACCPFIRRYCRTYLVPAHANGKFCSHWALPGQGTSGSPGLAALSHQVLSVIAMHLDGLSKGPQWVPNLQSSGNAFPAQKLIWPFGVELASWLGSCLGFSLLITLKTCIYKCVLKYYQFFTPWRVLYLHNLLLKFVSEFLRLSDVHAMDFDRIYSHPPLVWYPPLFPPNFMTPSFRAHWF